MDTNRHKFRNVRRICVKKRKSVSYKKITNGLKQKDPYINKL